MIRVSKVLVCDRCGTMADVSDGPDGRDAMVRYANSRVHDKGRRWAVIDASLLCPECAGVPGRAHDPWADGRVPDGA